MTWTPITTDDGSVTLRCPRTGALSHSTFGAWLEARERYAAPTRLAERARTEPRLRLLDVGTGLGWNLAAALLAIDRSPCRLDVVGLELDAGPIERALELAAAGELGPPEVARHHAPAARALAAALADPERSAQLPGGGRLRLLLGDARLTLPELSQGDRFDAVFLDPFALGEDPALWEPGFLAEIARRMAPGGVLSTYTASLRIRVRLARAGLGVGRGPRVGWKAQGTLASPDLELPALEPRAARKLRRRLAQDRSPTP